MNQSPAPFEITGEGLQAVASAPGICVGFEGQGAAALFKRRAIRRHPDGTTERVEVAVAELDGVRAYVRRAGDAVVVILSRDDLYP